MACARLDNESKIIRSSPQASFPKLTILFEACSCDMYLLHSCSPLQISKSFQVPFSPFPNSCLFKMRVKIWVAELILGNSKKFRNKLLSFHYLQKAIAQNNERN